MVGFNQKVPGYVDRLTSIQRSNFWLNEDVVIRRVGLRSTADDPDPRKRFGDIIRAVGKGHIGDKRQGTRAATGKRFDLRDENNSEGIYFVERGDKNKDKGGTEHGCSPRWFAFVAYDEKGKAVPMFNLDAQVSIVKGVTGRDPRLAEAVATRRADWKKWWQGAPGGSEFKRVDVPLLAKHFSYAFPYEIPNDVNWTRDGVLLRGFEHELKEIVRCSGEIGLASARCADTHMSRTPTGSAQTVQASARANEADSEEEVSSSSKSSSSGSASIPDALKVSELRCKDLTGSAFARKVEELASIDAAFQLMKERDNGNGVALSNDTLCNMMTDAEVPPPKSIALDTIDAMSPAAKGYARRNVDNVKEELKDRFGGIFWPKEDTDTTLHQWLDAGRRYTDGKPVAANNYMPNKDNPQQLELTDDASHCIRHIAAVFDIHPDKFPHLWACFYVLFFRQEIPLTEFSSGETLKRHMMRLNDVDKGIEAQQFEEFICTLSPNGFHRYWYMSSDDSKHHKRNRHNVISGTHRGRPNAQEWDPTYFLHTTSESYAKDSESLAQLNVDSFSSTGYSLRTNEKLGGGTTDNAAITETKATYSNISAQLVAQGQAPAVPFVRFGMGRRCIYFGDPFHDDNLICNAASVGMNGSPEKGNHRQKHPKQVCQSTHDLNTNNRGYSQWAMDNVMEGTGKKVKIKTARQRDTRWCADQRNCRWQLEKLNVRTSDGTPSLVAWAVFLSNNHSSTDYRKIARELATWFQMKSVVLSFVFEGVLGEYFERSMYYHCRKSALGRRPGFRMLEIHDILLDFSSRWWQKAVEDPAGSAFKPVYKYLNDNFDDEQEIQLKKQQILQGINAGYKAHVKHTRYLLTCPIVFIILRRSKEGPALLKAMLAIMYHHADLNDDRDLKRMMRTGYGEFLYRREGEQRPAEEEKWYKLLKGEAEDLVYWWKRFGLLDNTTIWSELKQLSKESPGTRKEGIVPFKEEYPIIFEFLDYTFGGMPSNSRMVEQLHGMLRWYLQDNQSIEYTDMVHGYRMRQGFDFNEERRDAKRSLEVDDEDESGKPKSKKPRVEASKTKADANMQSRQLLDSCAKYAGKVKGGTGVRKIADRGFRGKDKKVDEEKRREHEKKRAARLKDDDKDANYYKEIAKKMKLDNDSCWVPAQMTREQEWTARIASKAFWEGEVPNKIGFHQKLLRVFLELSPKSKGILRSAINHPGYPTSCPRHPSRSALLNQVILPHVKLMDRAVNNVKRFLTDEADKKNFTAADMYQMWIKSNKVGPTRSKTSGADDEPDACNGKQEVFKTFLKANGTNASTQYTYDKKFASYFESVEMELEDLAAELGADPENIS